MGNPVCTSFVIPVLLMRSAYTGDHLNRQAGRWYVSVRVLLVDDNESVLGELRALLFSHPGWLVGVDGFEAVEKTKSLRPDIVLSGHLHASNEWARGNPNHPPGST